MRRFERILVDVDPRATHHPELHRGAAIARAEQAEMVIAGVMTERDLPAGADFPEDTERVDELNARLRALAATVHGVTVTPVLLFGSPAEALIEHAYRWKADLLVRSRSRDTVEPCSGVDRQLIRGCPAPVFLVGPGVTPRHPRVVGAVGPSDAGRKAAALNRRVVDVTMSISAIEKGSAILLHAFRPLAVQLARDSRLQAAACMERWRTEATAQLGAVLDDVGADGRHVELVARHGAVDDVLPEFIVAQGIDIVVFGVPRRRGLARWMLGNTAERLLRYTPCSVLAVA